MPGSPLIADPKLPAHQAAATVTADEILRPPSFRRTVALSNGGHGNSGSVLQAISDLPAEAHDDVRTPRCMFGEEALDVHLIGAVNGLRILIGGGHAELALRSLRARRHGQAGELVAG
jgi:hypothetical protein